MAWLEKYRRLMVEARFYEAHVTAEEIMRHVDRRMGQCLAVYAALALKVNEGLPRAVDHLLGLLEERGCGRYVSMECARRLAMAGRAGGESVVCLLPF